MLRDGCYNVGFNVKNGKIQIRFVHKLYRAGHRMHEGKRIPLDEWKDAAPSDERNIEARLNQESN